MTNHEPVHILTAEYVGDATIGDDGLLDIGGLKVPVWHPPNRKISVYVRRVSSDLSVAEIVMARHDGLAQEVLDEENMEAERYPLGPKEYWRGQIVGKWTTGMDAHPMTDIDFEEYWTEMDED